MPTAEALIIESMLSVIDKDGNEGPFVLNAEQRSLDDNWTGRDLIPKARQLGVSTYVLARYTVACMMYKNINAVVISHESEATSRMLEKVRYFVNNIRGPDPVIKSMSANRIAFTKTNSQFYIGTAGSKAFGRGDTIHRLHCSEYAFWPNPLGLLTGLLQAVPSTGEVAIESTGFGAGNDYHRRCIRAYQGQSSYYCHFLNWLDNQDYQIDLSPEERKIIVQVPDLDLEEDTLQDVLTPEQLAWRRMKVEELDNDLRKFKSEYPITIDECFQASGGGLFWKVNYIAHPGWKRLDHNEYILEGHPRLNFHYVIGADPSGGVGADNAAVEIFCIETQEQVGEWANNTTPPDAFATVLVELGHKFGDAFIVVENNNHGILTLSKLVDEYPPYLIYYQSSTNAKDEIPQITQLGFRTTERTKPLAVGRFRQAVAAKPEEAGIMIYSPLLKTEMDTYVEDKATGKMGAQEGCDDDRVMASAMAQMGWNDAGLIQKSQGIIDGVVANDPFMLKNIIEELRAQADASPFAPQHSTGGGPYD